MSRSDRLFGGAAVVMALCCAVLPLVGAAIGGGLVSTGGVGAAVAGTVVLIAVGVFVLRRRTRGSQC